MSRLFTLFALVCLALPAAAQDCTIAVYGDPAGDLPTTCADRGQVLTIYVLIHAEDTVAAAAYSLVIDARTTLFLQGRTSGPSGNGLVIDEPGGTNVALGECVIGFGGNQVLVDEYRFFMVDPNAATAFWVEPNIDQDPDNPLYVTCTDVIKPCAPGPVFSTDWDCWGLPSDARSFGAVKSLFHNE